MTTYISSGSVTVLHNSDAAYRAWGSALSAALQGCGLVMTADTGQVDWLTVTRPSINTFNGYEIYRFDDAMQATAPIFIKVQYGTGSSTTHARILLIIGTGSNGSGTITGTQTANQGCIFQTGTSFSGLIYACHTEGSFFLTGVPTNESTSPPMIAVSIHRTDDGSGNPDDYGAVVLTRPEGIMTGSGIVGSVQTIRFAMDPNQEVYLSNMHCIINFPHARVSYMYGADYQYFLPYVSFPKTKLIHGVLGYANADLTPYTAAISLTPVGSATYDYMPTGPTSLGVFIPGLLRHSVLYRWD
jgi:hypothetical protein